MRIVVIGALGVVGKAVSTYFTINCHEVICNDIKKSPGIISLEKAIGNEDYIFVCVPTPPKEDGSIDISIAEKVTRDVGRICSAKKHKFNIVYKSTMVPGSCERLQSILKEYSQSFNMAYNPEFLRQNHALEDMIRPNRIIVGSDDVIFADVVMDLYRNTDVPKFTFDSFEAAELVKYYANAYYAARISFFNQMSWFAEKFKCNHKDIVSAIVADETVGKHGSDPVGVPFRGACLPKDLSAIVNCGEKNRVDVRLLKDVERINKLMIEKTSNASKLTKWVSK